MTWFFTNLLGALLLPPMNLLLLATAGLLLWRKRPRLGRSLVTVAIALLWLLSTPFIAESLLRSLEPPPLSQDGARSADAIVILGGGTYFSAPEYGTDTVSAPTLERLRYGAWLSRATGKPVLVSGGKPLGNQLSEAEQMRNTLEQEFHVPVRWIEKESNNTYDNARLSFQLLQQSGIRRIYLVTHAWHMPRAQRAFEQAGFEVVPAPTAYTTRFRYDLLAWMPQADALRDSRIYLHEQIGRLWYRLKS